MTEQEKQELSKAVADKYGVDSHRYLSGGDVVFGNAFWLHDDSARCFDLMVEHEINFTSDLSGETIIASHVTIFAEVTCVVREDVANHSTQQEATRIAILKALLAKE